MSYMTYFRYAKNKKSQLKFFSKNKTPKNFESFMRNYFSSSTSASTVPSSFFCSLVAFASADGWA